MSNYYRLALWFPLILLTACASRISTDITTFRASDVGSIPGSVEIRPRDTEPNATSLEFDYYAERLAQKLSGLGLQRVDKNADYIAYLDFGIERQQAEERSSPYIHGYYATSLVFGHYNRGALVLSDASRDRFEFKRIVYFSMNKRGETGGDNKDAQKVIEITAISIGRCGQFVKVYDEMLDAIFSNVNRKPGSVERVVVPADEAC